MPKTAHNIAIAVLSAGALFGAFFVWTRVIEERRLAAPCPATLQYSYFSTPGVFDEAYANAPARKADARAKALIVPHHLLAAPLIAEAFGSVATERAVTVVLVSPNHFSSGGSNIITTPSAWRTPYGVLKSDCDAVERLRAAGAATVEEAPFEREHGVSGIVPFIKKSLPNARIVPLIVKEKATDAELERAAETIAEIFGTRVLMVGSFDFTHELTATAAAFHDRKSLAVLAHLDQEGARALDIDATQGLRLLLKHADRARARRFSLFAHSNAAEWTKRPDMPDVTSYITGTFGPGAHAEDRTFTLLAFGDMMLARAVEQTIEREGAAFLFSGMPRLFKGSDIVTANTEGVFADVPDAQKPKAPDDLRFPFEPFLLPVLKRSGFTHLGLANNHSLNFGRSALDASRDLLRTAGLETFGDPENSSHLISMTEVRGRKIAQIGYHQFSGHGPEDVLKAIEEAKRQGAFTIVYPHWGIEYQPKPSKFQTDLAHRFIDAGADAVLGTHPHVIQTMEVYKGKAIFYSLGNFIFDQSFSAATSEGLAVGIADDEKETTYYLMPFDIRSGQPSLMPHEKGGRLLQRLSGDSSVPNDLKNAIATGTFTLTHAL